MQILWTVTELLKTVENRNRKHPYRLYGTLARGAVWSCLNRTTWALPELARVLRWGTRQNLITRTEARRMWHLIRVLVEMSETEPDPVRTTLQPMASHMNRPWQEWATEKLVQTREEPHEQFAQNYR